MILFALIGIAIAVLEIASVWVVFQKASQPGWGSLIPIYNTYLWLKMANRPGWWLLLLFIPIVNFVIAIIINVDVAKAFGKSTLFAVLFLFFAVIMMPMLAFGSSTYARPVRPA